MIITATANTHSGETGVVLFAGRLFLLTISAIFLFLFLGLPLIVIFHYAFEKGWEVYLNSLTDSYTLSALSLSIKVTFMTVLVNIVFGLSAAWLFSRFKFRGRTLLLTFVELPLAISPVIVGMMFILLFGASGVFAQTLKDLDYQIIFAVPGIVLATIFITLPYIARELLPLMEAQGRDDEEAALSLGASGAQMFWHVTLPNIRFGLFYGIVLCSARALGEFGAVSVVSGHIRGLTNTLPLHIEVLYNEYNFTASFACASVMTCIAFISLVLRELLTKKGERK